MRVPVSNQSLGNRLGLSLSAGGLLERARGIQVRRGVETAGLARGEVGHDSVGDNGLSPPCGELWAPAF